MEFLILTAARSGETIGARWDELDLDQAMWSIPATRMKSGRPHRVPLAPAALTLNPMLSPEPTGSTVSWL